MNITAEQVQAGAQSPALAKAIAALINAVVGEDGEVAMAQAMAIACFLPKVTKEVETIGHGAIIA